MTTLDSIVSVASVVLGTAAIIYVIYLYRVSGRDHVADPGHMIPSACAAL